MSNWPPTHEEQRAALEGRGYVEIAEAPVCRGGVARTGDRVHNRGEQYVKAYWHGTAVVVAIYERLNSEWSRRYGERDIEIITQRDRDPEGVCPMCWANYGTVLPDRALSWCVLPDGHAGRCSQRAGGR